MKYDNIIFALLAALMLWLIGNSVAESTAEDYVRLAWIFGVSAAVAVVASLVLWRMYAVEFLEAAKWIFLICMFIGWAGETLYEAVTAPEGLTPTEGGFLFRTALNILGLVLSIFK